ncbi:hypothetical protein Hesp01_53070 [Herbidospora sp. NBRC 101105]|nr:hypothetical protein Hesp01_53070 [Herbidospora sp. NBRC 101105]
MTLKNAATGRCLAYYRSGKIETSIQRDDDPTWDSANTFYAVGSSWSSVVLAVAAHLKGWPSTPTTATGSAGSSAFRRMSRIRHEPRRGPRVCRNRSATGSTEVLAPSVAAVAGLNAPRKGPTRSTRYAVGSNRHGPAYAHRGAAAAIAVELRRGGTYRRRSHVRRAESRGTKT